MERLSRALVFTALLILLSEPAWWLAKTWVEPNYESPGELVALLCAALVLRSVLSGPAPEDPRARRIAWLLFGGAALTRLAGRSLDIHHLGALALVPDVAALALYLRLHARPTPVHPAALAGLFALSLPVEQLMQHVIGHPLRIASAAVTELALSPFVPGLQRTGALISAPGTLLQVDLPCSGAQGLYLFGVAAWTFACTRRVGLAGALTGTAAVLLGALLANALRLGILVVGPTEQLVAEPAHSLVGLVAMAVGALPVLAVATRLDPREPAVPTPTAAPIYARYRLPIALAAVATAIGVSLAPKRPLDTSADLPDLALPATVADHLGEPRPLSELEQAYFGKFGGTVQRTTYRGPDGAQHSALLVATTAPVRHLHGAELCLKGAGHDVERLHIRPTPVPTTVYKSIAPDGTAWRVESTLVSASGEIVETPSEVVWRWMREGGAWMRIERVTPWALCEADPGRCDRFDRALLASLDVPISTEER